MDRIEEARRLEADGNPAAAAALYEEAFEHSEQDWLAVKAGELYRDAGDPERGRAVIDRVKGCGNPILHDRLIDFHLSLSDWAGASELFAELFPDAPLSKKVAFADRLQRAGAFEEAEAWFLSCVGPSSEEPSPYLSRTGDYGDAVYGSRVLRILRRGDEAFVRGHFREAFMQYGRVARRADYALKKQAECSFLLKDFEKAEELYRALVQKTDDPYYRFMLAECYNSEDIGPNTLENAVYWYEYALEGGCDLACYHLGLCCQFGRGTPEDPERAERLFEAGVRCRANAGDCLCKLGTLAYRRGEAEKALAFYRRAAGLNNARALLNLAIGCLNGEIEGFLPAEVRCFLARSAALGSRRALEVLEELKGQEEPEEPEEP